MLPLKNFSNRFLFFSVISFVVFTGTAVKAQKASHAKEQPHTTLVWADEFNATDGSQPDSAKWLAVENGSGFGNNEQEYYTARAENVRLAGGNLQIIARKESYTGKDGARAYTSARLETRGRFEFQYGRAEARIKIPFGQGIWPAFWMLGTDFEKASWPECGEVDIMENVGFEPTKVHSSLHGPGYSGGNPLTGTYTLPDGAHFSDDFHVFAVEWQPGEMRFYVDGHLYETQRAVDLPAGKRWVFDHPFYIVLNVATGGYWPGMPDQTTSFPQTMLVDYVRVYKLDSAVRQK